MSQAQAEIPRHLRNQVENEKKHRPALKYIISLLMIKVIYYTRLTSFHNHSKIYLDTVQVPLIDQLRT